MTHEDEIFSDEPLSREDILIGELQENVIKKLQDIVSERTPGQALGMYGVIDRLSEKNGKVFEFSVVTDKYRLEIIVRDVLETDDQSQRQFRLFLGKSASGNTFNLSSLYDFPYMWTNKFFEETDSLESKIHLPLTSQETLEYLQEILEAQVIQKQTGVSPKTLENQNDLLL